MRGCTSGARTSELGEGPGVTRVGQRETRKHGTPNSVRPIQMSSGQAILERPVELTMAFVASRRLHLGYRDGERYLVYIGPCGREGLG